MINGNYMPFMEFCHINYKHSHHEMMLLWNEGYIIMKQIPGPPSQNEDRLIGMIIKIRRAWDRLIFIVGYLLW